MVGLEGVGTNNHYIDIYTREPDAQSFTTCIPTGVCVKGLSFPEKDLSQQLAHWLAIQIALGVSRYGACAFISWLT